MTERTGNEPFISTTEGINILTADDFRRVRRQMKEAEARNRFRGYATRRLWRRK